MAADHNSQRVCGWQWENDADPDLEHIRVNRSEDIPGVLPHSLTGFLQALPWVTWGGNSSNSQFLPCLWGSWMSKGGTHRLQINEGHRQVYLRFCVHSLCPMSSTELYTSLHSRVQKVKLLAASSWLLECPESPLLGKLLFNLQGPTQCPLLSTDKSSDLHRLGWGGEVVQRAIPRQFSL
jgi:hypothetical protein